MASTYNSNYFSIEKMTTGDKDGTWGELTNDNWIAIQQAIGANSVINTEAISGSSTYSLGIGSPLYGDLLLLLPDATSSSATTTDAKSRCSFMTITGTGLGSGGVVPYPDFVRLNVCGITSTTAVDRMYFIKNELTPGLIQPNTILRVYNGDGFFTGSYVEINNGSTALVSFTSDPKSVTDATQQLKIKTIDMDNTQGGKILLRNQLASSLAIVQVDDLNAEVAVASINTTKGVTDVSIDSGGNGTGYVEGLNELTFSGGVPLTGTGVTAGTFTVVNGVLTNTTITHRGQNWQTAPNVGFDKGVQVRNLALNTPGTSYTPGTYPITFTGGSPDVPANGTFTVAPSGSTVTTVFLAYGGRGYQTAPTATCVQSGASGGDATVLISSNAAATATLGDTSTVDLSASSSIIRNAVIEESSIGLVDPQPGKFTTLESSSSTVLGGNANDIINITGLIDGPIEFSVDNDTTPKNILGTDKSRITSLVSSDITINKGDDEQILLFKGGGLEAKGAGVNTTQVGRIITDFTDETISMESASDWSATGGIRVKLDNTDRKAYISTNAGLTGIGTINLTAGGSGYSNGFNQAYNLSSLTNTSLCNVLYDVQFGVVIAMRINYQGQGYTATPDNTTDPVPGGGSGCTFTTTLGGVVDTLIGGQSQERVTPDPSTSLTTIGNYFTDSQPASGNTSAGENVVFDMGVRQSTPVLWRTGARCTTAESGYIAGDEIEISSKGVTFRSSPFRMVGSTWMTWLDPANSHAMMSFIGGSQGSFQTVRQTDGHMISLIASRWDFFIHAWW